ncbi:RDD family protein [Nocardiopsis suaedae]|uniref:RDD family protein n=1 Tax=Nocardiopsis suaedae TaxID=3018444 RepID=A0ABT4TMQ9_9ACTN|nr:RDD family protein [Nocardiopsis suaedae]MDA2805656.1 RDD family protein [Nocardiopsis suaedae]
MPGSGTGVDDLAHQAALRLDGGKPAEALPLIERALTSQPESGRLWRLKAVAHERLDQDEKAIEASRKAIALNGESADAYAIMAFAIIGLGRAHDAYRSGEAILRLDPDSVRGHIIVAMSLADCVRKRFPGAHTFPAQARAAVQRAVELQPEDHWVQGQVGVVLRWLGSDKEAVSHFREALRLNPEYVHALRNLAAIEAKRRRRMASLRYLRAVLALAPGDKSILHSAYGICRRTTRVIVLGSVAAAIVAMNVAIPVMQTPSGEGDSGLFWLRMAVAGVTTVAAAAAFAYLVRIPKEIRRSLLQRRAGRPWAVAFALVPLSAAAIGWLPPSWIGLPIVLFVGALVANAVLVRVVDRDAFDLRDPWERSGPSWGRPDEAPHPAAPERRFAALVIDALVIGLTCLLTYLGLVFCLVIAVRLTPIPPGAVTLYIGSALVVLGVLAAPLAYLWLPTARTGQTVGKRRMGIRVVDPETAGPPSRKAAAVRAGLMVVFMVAPFLFLADAVLMLRDRPYLRTARDHLTGTWVVQA